MGEYSEEKLHFLTQKKRKGRTEEAKKENIFMRGWMSHYDNLQSLPLSAFISLNVLLKMEFIIRTCEVH